MQCVLAHRHAARFEIGMELVDAECTGGIAQELSHHPVQYLRLAEVVALNHIAQENNIDIGPQELKTVAGIEPLGFGKAAVGEVIKQIIVEL